MKITQKLYWHVLFLLLVWTSRLEANLVINEVMYHPASQNLQESYVELFNSGPTAIDLTGWKFIEGIQFEFPTNTSIGAGGYLVVAADIATFTHKYPGVTEVVAGWIGAMSTHLKLADAKGQVVSDVNFSNDGDWAVRTLRSDGPNAFGHAGWEWAAGHDGQGYSLELINPSLPVEHTLNWGSSSVPEGTPGKVNSRFTTNAAPLVLNVTHSPIVPNGVDPVTITARILDDQPSGLAAHVYYRNATTTNPPPFTSLSMLDDGSHGDGLAADGIYGAILPPQPNGTVVEFYLEAQDATGNVRTYPAVLPPGNSLRTANLLYQVDQGNYQGTQPLYRVIMTELERQELYEIGLGCPAMDSDAQMNATWISMDQLVSGGITTQVRYNVGIRNRGHGTRSSNPNNYHVNIPGDRPWKNTTGINLNSQRAQSQILGSAIFRRAGVPMAESRAVQLRVNGTNLMLYPYTDSRPVDTNSFGSYAANEQYNGDFIKRTFALDPYGNSYRGIRDQTLCDSSRNSVADLTWHGSNYAVGSYTNAYFKQNNLLENDWADLLDLIAVLNSQNGYHPSNYVNDVSRRLNVDEWMRYMALNTLLDNTETCLANGVGDDYGLYRGTNDERFLALPYDLDSLMGRGTSAVSPHHNIFSMTNLAVMDRFMKQSEFAPLYYGWLKKLADTVFTPAQMNPVLDQILADYVPGKTLDNFKAFNASQVNWVLSQIPLELTVSNNLPVQSGYPRTTTSTVALHGTANAVETRNVLVNGSPAVWIAWQGTWTLDAVPLRPGLNRVRVQAFDRMGVELAQTYTDLWYDAGTGQTVGGTVTGAVKWTAANGPYNVSSALTIAAGATLTIEPGTTVYLGSGISILVANGGRLLAEGTAAAPIRFSVAPGSSVSWGGITINGAENSPETRIAYAHFEGNGSTCIEVAGGTLYLDHATFGTTTHQYVSLDNSSFLISSCVFPSTTAPFELLHGTGGIKAGGRGIVRGCFFGTTSGYNDIMDFTGGNRDLNQPIIQYYNNVFIGGSDDGLDLDGTDAWIEHNIFLHVHKNGAPDSSSAVSGGSDGGRTSEVTIMGNLFFDCDQAATAKQGNFFTLLNNTIVHMTKTGGLDTEDGVVNVQDRDPGPPTTYAAGCYLEGNIVVDVNQLVRNYDPAQTTVTWNNNIIPTPWAGPGTSNSVVDPLLRYLPSVAETYFTNWESAQILWDWFSLRAGSPAHETGPNGLDKGGVVPLGVSISGEPTGTNNQASATLTVGTLRTGFGIPSTGWPNGSGYTHYKWRLDSGDWSAETPATEPLQLNGLSNGPHRVEVVGKRDSGWYQDAVELGPDALVTTSRTWVVDTAYGPPVQPTVRLNEILALNTTTLTNAGTTPDLIELYNCGDSPVDLSGMGLSDNASAPYKFTFPAGTPPLPPGQYLVLYADKSKGPGIHLGFSLKNTGDDVYLHDKAERGGSLLDSVVFGIQPRDLSIGRAVDGSWQLCQPTFGTENRILALANPHRLRINEWLTDELFLANNDFVELYNPTALPIALGGCYLSNAEGSPSLNPIADLSFIAPGGYLSLVADSDATQGGDHLNFKLDPNVGILILSDAEQQPIDIINYGPQSTDIAQGRSPSGSDTFATFTQPTAGGPNPVANGGGNTVTNISTTLFTLLDITSTWKYDNSGGTNLGTSWIQPAYNDSSWSNGTGLFGHETTPAEYPFPFNTYVPAPKDAGGKITIYYRAHFAWDGHLTNATLVATNYIDDGAVYYLNGTRIGAIRLPAVVTYNTLASDQPNEGTPEILFFTNAPVLGDNVVAVEVHQVNATSSDDVFGIQLNAIQRTTNLITTAVESVPVVLNEVLASNHSLTNTQGTTADWVELYNPTTNTLDLADISLSNDPNQPRKYVIAPETHLGPGQFLLLYCDNQAIPSTNNTGFSLNAVGDSVLLFDRLTNGGGLLDAITFGWQTPDFSIGRIPDGSGTWVLNSATPNAHNQAAGLATVGALGINEWMADPSSGSDWFELFNSASQPVALGGLFFTGDLTRKTDSPIPPLTFIGTGPHAFSKFQADSNPNAGADHVRFKLSKSGDSIGLFSAAGTQITAVTFGPQQTDVSQGHFPDGSTNLNDFPVSSSPGFSNFLPLTNVVVNEVLTHTDLPLEDAVEFYNSSNTNVDISGWFLSNSQANPKAYRIPNGTIIPPKGYWVIYENAFNNSNSFSSSFTFNSAHGDQAVLAAADADGNLTGFRAVAIFGPAANGVSFGRYTNSLGQIEYAALSAHTFGVDNPGSVEQFRSGTGAPNSAPMVGPVVISEVMFYPPLIGGVEDDTLNEYVELANFTGLEVKLFDPTAPTNTWRVKGGIDFTFPENTTLPPQSLLLLVNFNPASDLSALSEFRARYSLNPAVPLYGPYGGHLDNSGESLELYKPDPPQLLPHPDAGFVPYVLVDKLNYASDVPWPNGAAGTGLSLQRSIPSQYGNDPLNWFTAAPTAGRPNQSNSDDANGDGLPDAWQIQYFGSSNVPQAAPDADPDHDGFTNLKEWLAGTDPTQSSSYLHLEAITVTSTEAVLQFQAVAGKSYSILFSPAFGSAWKKLVDIPADSITRNLTVKDARVPGDGARFYRLVTPIP